VEVLHSDYVAALQHAPVDENTRRAYASRVRQYLAWLQTAAVDGDPLADAAGRDWAVRDYRAHLQSVAKRTPATINTSLAAISDFYTRRGLGQPNVRRLELPQTAPRALFPRQAHPLAARGAALPSATRPAPRPDPLLRRPAHRGGGGT
jgi:integrase/recombinase XerC